MSKRISAITLAGCKREKQDAREVIGMSYDATARALGNEVLFDLLSRTTVGMLDRKVKHDEHLSFDEAFCGMCYVLAATNASFMASFQHVFDKACGGNFTQQKALAIGSAFINLMATKESLRELTPDEVAGMVAAAMMDCVVLFEFDAVVETCGMGGDKGFGSNGTARKSINASTLSSLVLAAVGVPTIKHGSYSNTSAVGSTESIEHFGAITSIRSVADVRRIWERSRYCYFDAHWCKTIHDLSHLLMMETINHIIGPMTPPITKDTLINKLMGVNEKVHPETIAKAYAILHSRGMQRVGGVLIVSGLDSSYGAGRHDILDLKKHAVIDEVSPYATVVSGTYGDKFMGTCIVRPSDFGIEIDPSSIQVPNNRVDIQSANVAALCGNNTQLSAYLAMNASLGLYAVEKLKHHEADSLTTDGLNKSWLRECYVRCLEAIMSGKVRKVLETYVIASGGVPKID